MKQKKPRTILLRLSKDFADTIVAKLTEEYPDLTFIVQEANYGVDIICTKGEWDGTIIRAIQDRAFDLYRTLFRKEKSSNA